MTRAPHLDRRAVLATAGSILLAGCLGSGRPPSLLEADPTPATREADWRMYGRDPGRSRFVPDASLPRDGVDVAWQRSTGASGWLPPIVATGTVYCQYANGLFVLDVETGEGSLAKTHGGFGRGTGPMAFGSTELYRDGVLIVPYGDPVGGYAADPDGWPAEVDGLGERRSRWWTDGETATPEFPGGSAADFPWLASPVVADGSVVSVHPTAGIVSAVDGNDGSPRWRYELENADLDAQYPFTPLGHVVDTASGTVVVMGRIAGRPAYVGIDLADGSLEWTDGEDTASERAVDEQDSLSARDGSVYSVDRAASGRELRVLEVDAATGDRGWERPLARTGHVGIAVDETTVFHVGLEADGGSDPFAVTALSRTDGTVYWETTVDDSPGNVWSAHAPPPTVAGEHLLVPGGLGLHAFDRRSGDHLWTFTETVGTSGGGETERAGLTPAVVSDDRIVLGTTVMLYCLEGGR
ncbi:outer membrane protein assembly factor BamB family protein [Natrarchaeobius chitinivorans]|uniref:Pyrrolo-quinoline quinone repeat domain-containing protein n=1 Tax=Natrarchaeobius chitinivorans TaxID=1679083 RepID=A0A3N6LV03_NATCH|nr:PQQ-binding-like beta-propeller repeat protein [Natrarchaeobius chitinivorans]RQG92557.1 hypothetical protein EA473_16240 [Natrarchaeobius chitinivorans]